MSTVCVCVCVCVCVSLQILLTEEFVEQMLGELQDLSSREEVGMCLSLALFLLRYFPFK